MSENGQSKKQHFLKQRRNLIVVSLVIIFYEVADIEITQINILGNTALINNPEIVLYCIVAFFIYFNWRYFPALHDVHGFAQFVGKLKERTDRICFRSAREHIAKKVGTTYDKIHLNLKHEDIPISHKRYTYVQNTYEGGLGGKITSALKDIKEYQLNFASFVKAYVTALFQTLLLDIPSGEYLLPILLSGFALMELLGIGLISHILLLITS